jgi:hypothetical protein
LKPKTFKNKFFFFFFGSLCFWFLNAQKVLEKEFSLPPNGTVELSFPWADKIIYHGLETQKKLKIVYRAEGEYQNQTHLSEKKSGTLLKVGEKFFPLFTPPNDKLSAHKNIVSNVQVFAPTSARVLLESKDASVFVKGMISEIELFLENGHCLWDADLTKGKIETVNASVEVRSKDIVVLASSQNGLVQTLPLQQKTPHLMVRSINGDILQR